jgi:hypothetical protein
MAPLLESLTPRLLHVGRALGQRNQTCVEIQLGITPVQKIFSNSYVSKTFLQKFSYLTFSNIGIKPVQNQMFTKKSKRVVH